MHIAGAETRKCPEEFQARLTDKFGRNQFGEPNFKVAWNQSQFIRLAREGKDKFGRRIFYYRDCYQGDGQGCWTILCWKPPAHYGSPDTYYANTWIALERKEEQGHDSAEGFYVTAGYPWQGRYEIVVPLISKEFVDGKLLITHMPLSHYLIDVVIPLIVKWQELSHEEKEAAKQAEAEAESRRQTQQIEDMLMDRLPAWYGPVSFSRQGCRTALLDRKMYAIQQQWNRMARYGVPIFQRGMAQGNRPVIQGYR